MPWTWSECAIGWLAAGVSMPFGSQTRHHRDLDLAVDADDFNDCMVALGDLGYIVETDWLPLRVEVVAGGERWVDVHPVRFDAEGYGLQGDRDGSISAIRRQHSLSDEAANAPYAACQSASNNSFTAAIELRPHDEHDLQRVS